VLFALILQDSSASDSELINSSAGAETGGPAKKIKATSINSALPYYTTRNKNTTTEIGSISPTN
jgi:hypothetical protein